MAETDTQLPLELVAVDEDCVHLHVGTDVAQRTIVGIELLQACKVFDGLLGEQVAGVVYIKLDAGLDAVLDKRAVEGNIEFAGAFPLDGGVLDVVELKSRGILQVRVRFKISACKAVVDVVVTCNLISCGHFQVVDAPCFLHPAFVGDDPCGLNAGEETPLHAEELQSLCCFSAKA